MTAAQGIHTNNTQQQLFAAKLRDAIENHPLNSNYGLRADDIAALLEGSAKARQSLFWRDLIDGQMDADRMDYLLRDSCHAGVQYGRYDLHRVIATIQAIPDENRDGPRLGISEGGWHGAEALVLARYFMFTQVYFHKTRVAFDIHLREALKILLPGGAFPRPINDELEQYLAWDDWRVLGLLASGQGGEHGGRLTSRNHFRNVHHTPEVSALSDMKMLQIVKESLGDLIAAEESASKSWYKTGAPDIPVVSETGEIKPLSKHSSVLSGLKSSNQVLLYARPECASKARSKIAEVLKQYEQHTD
jgi:HD superfamily phosphohydrolase